MALMRSDFTPWFFSNKPRIETVAMRRLLGLKSHVKKCVTFEEFESTKTRQLSHRTPD